jgi:phenylalanyl-tRNA synthetase alpha subunit
MREKIEDLQARGTAAIAAATATAELEQTRVAYLGRKAELPNLLRGVAELPPEERSAVGRAANEARRRSRRPSRRAAPSSSARSSTSGSRPTPSTSRSPARPPSRSGGCT